MVDAGNRRQPRHDAGSEHDVVERREVGGRDLAPESQVDAGEFDPAAEIAQRLTELLLAGNPLRQVELAADFRRSVEQRHRVPGLGGGDGAGEASRAGADDCDRFSACRRHNNELGLAARAGIDEARGDPAFEDLVEARLIAGDTGVDLVGASRRRLADEFGVGEERPRHRHHVGVAARKEIIGNFGIVDPVGGDQRDRHLALHPPRHPGERRPRHHRGDGRHPRLVPADAGVEQRRAGRLDALPEPHDLVPRAAALDQIEHRQPVDDDEIAADRGARPAHDLQRKTDPVLERPAPLVVAMIGPRRDELVDEVAFGSHDLDAVVAGALGELRAADIGGDRPAHAPAGERRAAGTARSGNAAPTARPTAGGTRSALHAGSAARSSRLPRARRP